jgi:hypothetical protein
MRNTVGTDYGTLTRVQNEDYVFEAVAAPEVAALEEGDTVALETTNCLRVVATERTLVLRDVEANAPDLADRAGNADWGISCHLGAPVSVDGEMDVSAVTFHQHLRTAEEKIFDVLLADREP